MDPDELRARLAEGRLALVPVERILVGDSPRYTAAEVAERSGVEDEFLDALLAGDRHDHAPTPTTPSTWTTTWMPPSAWTPCATPGLGDDAILEMARVMSSGMSTLAVTIASVFADSYLEEGDDEASLSERYAEAAENLLPLLGPALEHALMVQNRSNLRQASAIGSSLAEGRLPDAAGGHGGLRRPGRLHQAGRERRPGPPGRRGRAAGGADARRRPAGPCGWSRPSATRSCSSPPTPWPCWRPRWTCWTPPTARTTSSRRSRWASRADEAISRGGDLFGHSVNLASRVTSTARPGSVLVTEEVKDAAGEDGYRYSFAGERKLKGVKEPQKLFRARRRDGRRARAAELTRPRRPRRCRRPRAGRRPCRCSPR